jgi:hypothetical protein
MGENTRLENSKRIHDSGKIANPNPCDQGLKDLSEIGDPFNPQHTCLVYQEIKDFRCMIQSANHASNHPLPPPHDFARLPSRRKVATAPTAAPIKAANRASSPPPIPVSWRNRAKTKATAPNPNPAPHTAASRLMITRTNIRMI